MYGYYDEENNSFYSSLAFSEETKLTMYEGTFYYDLFKFDGVEDNNIYDNTDGVYFYIGENL